MEDRRLAAIMFTDIVGYSELMGKDEDRAFELLRNNREIQKPLIKKYRGQFLKEMGDGILASFPSATDAVSCAKDIQEKAKKENITLRIGIHEGEVVFDNDDVFGDGVNVASRLESEAVAGEVVFSGAVYREIKNKAGFKTAFIEEKILKGIDEPVKIFKLLGDNKENIPANSITKKRRIKPVVWASIASSLIVSSMVLWIVIYKNENPALEKSLAVLPLEYLSENPDKQYLADGVMDAITGHLSRIQDLRVAPRTSVEQYRESTKTASVIGKELGVNYLIEGSFQMIGNNVKLIIQLVVAHEEDHVFYNEYDRDYTDIFLVQSEIAKTIAREVEAAITPEETKIIETNPTTNLTAYDFFLRARNSHTKYWTNRDDDDLAKAIKNYQAALQYDSSFARAYAGLGLAYNDNFSYYLALDHSYMDSVMIYANKAISFDDKLGEAHVLMGLYELNKNGNINKALEEFNLAISYEPNDYRAYFEKAKINFWLLGRYKDAIITLHEAISRFRGPEIEALYWGLARSYMESGFYDLAKQYSNERYKLTEDSALYFNSLGLIELSRGNFDKFVEYNERGDSTGFASLFVYEITRNYDKARLAYFKEIQQGELNIHQLHRYGHILLEMGELDMARNYFEKQIEACLNSINLNTEWTQRKSSYYDLSATYALIGKKEEAFRALEEIKYRHSHPKYMIVLLRNDPILDNLREDPRFDEIVIYVEDRYQREHESVKNWLEENNLL